MPMAIWSHRLPLEQMYLAISSEVRFTHDLPMVAKLVTAYCVAIRHLLLNAEDPNRRKGAFDAAKESA